jgi:hypothetical protein
LKRKRTGGKLGWFPLVLMWNIKRYANPETGETPCDPAKAKKIFDKANNDFRPQRLPYKDDDIIQTQNDEEDAPF